MEFDPIETCPFEKSHRIRRSRLQWHITICSKNNQPANMKRCHYNASHLVNEDQFDEHLLNCPSREFAMKSSENEVDTHDAPYILPVDTNQNAGAEGWGSGDWGNEGNFQAYNPLEAIQNRPIVHAKIGLSKSQRKKHRLQERKRFNEVTQKAATDDNK